MNIDSRTEFDVEWHQYISNVTIHNNATHDQRWVKIWMGTTISTMYTSNILNNRKYIGGMGLDELK